MEICFGFWKKFAKQFAIETIAFEVPIKEKYYEFYDSKFDLDEIKKSDNKKDTKIKKKKISKIKK